MSNKEFQVNYLPIAKKDLEEIIKYIQTDNPSAALDFLNQIDETISKLKEFPYMGKTPKDEHLKFLNYRMLVIENYLVFYTVKEEVTEVEIKRIIHGKRKYNFLI
ncbi:type II toxin-antitoxin system RelE/ParE family toxin [Selenihalanaerobacter shriftii]|uniref:Addiction module toxin, RelE/StbE family n=1 Tax=Selenihalanaerobacter shriftii TaxID=142842 RepID=A0A1T4QTI8_9FIRM|nr:type II toxin-antitoxin system mRNA interferase toxin, RelE/StbE family [Selenihalanaerobacter shriftii]SKA07030.1 addiction module toxin, RelE/StbE family [Selenihalanaerobacter shriftii]